MSDRPLTTAARRALPRIALVLVTVLAASDTTFWNQSHGYPVWWQIVDAANKFWMGVVIWRGFR